MGVYFYPELEVLLDGVSNFTIGITEQCNFRCAYCCYSGQYNYMRHHSAHNMTEDIRQKTLDFIKRTANTTSQLHISFYGGETLLEFNNVIWFIEKLEQCFGKRVTFDISTNGYLLTRKVVDDICSHPGVGISVSVDGSQEIHNRSRRLANGRPTYEQIRANLMDFKRRYPKEYTKRVRILVTLASYRDLETADKNFEELKSMTGEKNILVSRIVQNYSTNTYLKDSPEETRQFIAHALEYKQKGEVNLHTLVLDDLMKCSQKKNIFSLSLPTSESKGIRLSTCLNHPYSVFITTNGELFPCEKFGTKGVIGNVETGFDMKAIQQQQASYAIRRSLLCRDCLYIEYCTLCLKDSRMKFTDQKKFCSDYIENIKTAIKLKQK